MKMMKHVLMAVLGLGLLITPNASAQNLSSDNVFLAALWDADSGSYTYCRTLGINNQAADRHKQSGNNVRLSTSGSSTTVTGTNAFANIAVGDLLIVNDAGVLLYRTVVARASANSITVGVALDITSATFEWRKRECGTADTSGAFPVSGFHSLTFQIILSQEVSTSTDYQIECRVFGPATTWSIVTGPTNDTSTFNDVFATDLGFDECRVGVRVNTDDGDDLTTNAEQFTILVNRRK